MYTQDSFCSMVLGTTYLKVRNSYDKGDYSEFRIPKKGGYRKITYLKQESRLLGYQKKLLHNYFSKIDLPTCVYGFQKKESYRSYLSAHIGAQFYLRVDIQDFFPSISGSLLTKEFQKYVSMETEEETKSVIALLVDMATLNDALPQGAPTSPVLSNIVMAPLDQRIMKYCQQLGVTYSRYADDLLFSSQTIDFSEKKWFLRKIKYILGTSDFKINYSKIKHGNGMLSLNGYVISEKEVRLSRKRLSDIRHVLSRMTQCHDIYRNSGTAAFLEAVNTLSLQHRDLRQYPFESMFLLHQYLCGYRAFLISWVDPMEAHSKFQKELKHLISRIERTVSLFS